MKECYVCYRVERLAFFTYAFDLFRDEDNARFVAGYAADLMKKAYFKDPSSVCGKRADALIAGALYLACVLLNQSIVQKDIENIIGTTQVAIRNRSHGLARTLQIDFKKLTKEHSARRAKEFWKYFHDY